MIVRILGEGQFVVPDDVLDTLNTLDDDISAAVDADDQAALTTALASLFEHVRAHCDPVDADLLIDSDVILPEPDATLAELRELFGGNGGLEGLIPG